jgi:hypothetical protein
MPKHSCPYFTLSVGAIPIPGHLTPMRVPVCRCVLTETLVSRLKTHSEGAQLASYLEGPPLQGQPRPVIGSNLHPVSPVTCTDERKQAHCVPSFVDILTDFRLDTTLPEEI